LKYFDRGQMFMLFLTQMPPILLTMKRDTDRVCGKFDMFVQ